MEVKRTGIFLTQIFERIVEQIPNFSSRPFILGINGVDASGKSRFSKALLDYFKSLKQKAILIHVDDFHNPSSIRKKGKDEIHAYIDNAFNLELLEDKLLKPLKRDGKIDVKLTLLDLNADEYINTKHFAADEETIIIIEGVLLYRQPIDKYFDYRIFLDITFEEVLERARKRDVPIYGEGFLDKYKNKYIPIQKWYLENYKPKECSDLVIDNNDYNNPVVIIQI